MAKGLGLTKTIGVKLVVEEYELFVDQIKKANEAVEGFGKVLKGEGEGGFFGAATQGASLFSIALGVGIYSAGQLAVDTLYDVGKAAFNTIAEFEKTIQTVNAMTAVELMHGETVTDTHKGIMKMSAKEQEELKQTAWNYTILEGAIQTANDKRIKMVEDGKENTAQYDAQVATLEKMTDKLNTYGDTVTRLRNIDGTPYEYTTERQVSTVTNMDEALRAARQPAAEMIDRMTRLALISPFTRKGIMAAVEQGKAFGMTLKQTETLTSGLTKFATVTGRSEQHINRITYAMGQTKSMGKLMMRQVRQMNLAGLSVNDIAASMGMSVEKFNDEVGKGTISFDKLNTAMSEFFEMTYGDAFLAINDSFRGLKNAIGDIYEMVQVNLFTGLLEAFKPIMKAIVHPFTKGDMLATIKVFGDQIGLIFQDTFKSVADTITIFLQFFQGFVAKIADPIQIKISMAVEDQKSISEEKGRYEKTMQEAMEAGTKYSQQYMDNLGYIGRLEGTLAKDSTALTSAKDSYTKALGEEKAQRQAILDLQKKLGDSIWKDGEKGIQSTEGLAATYWALQSALGPALAKTSQYKVEFDRLTASQKSNGIELQDRKKLEADLLKSGQGLSDRYRELAEQQKYLESTGQKTTATYRKNAEEMAILTANTDLYVKNHPKYLKVQATELENARLITELGEKAGKSLPWLTAFRDTLLETHKASDPLVIIFDKLIVIFDKVAEAFSGAKNPEGKSIFVQMKEYFTSAIFTGLAAVLTFIADNIDILILFFTNVARVFAIIWGYGAIVTVIAKVAKVVAFLFTPLGTLLSVIGVLSKAYETNFGGFQTFVENFKVEFKKFVDNVVLKVKEVFNWGPEYTKAFDKVKQLVKKVTDYIRKQFTRIFGTPQQIQKWLDTTTGQIVAFFKGIKDKMMEYLPTAASIEQWAGTLTSIFERLTQPKNYKPAKGMQPFISLDNTEIYGWKDALVDVQVAYGETESKAKEITLTLADNIKWLELQWRNFGIFLQGKWEELKQYFKATGEIIVEDFKIAVKKIQDFFALDILNAIKTVWNYKAEGKSGYEQSFEEAKTRLATFFGSQKYEIVIDVTTNIVGTLAGMLDTIRLFFANEVPKTLADVFKSGYNQKDSKEGRPAFAEEQLNLQSGLGIDQAQSQTVIMLIESIGEKFRQVRDFAVQAYAETKKVIQYIWDKRDSWVPIALQLTAVLSVLTISGKIYNWLYAAFAGFSKSGVGVLLAKWLPKFGSWLLTFFTSPKAGILKVFEAIGQTWFGKIFGGLGKYALQFFAWGKVIIGYVTVFFGEIGAIIGLFSTAVGQYGIIGALQFAFAQASAAAMGLATSVVAAMGTIGAIAVVVAAVAWGFYTNFQGMTDNFYEFVSVLKRLWTEFIYPVLLSFWGGVKLIGGILYWAFVWVWEHMLKGVFEDLAAAFNNIILIVTWVLEIFLDLWNFLKPVLVPVFILLAVIVGGILAIAFIVVMGIIIGLIRILTLIVRVFIGFFWVVMEAIKGLGWLADSLWKATHENRSFADSMYDSTLVLGESGGIMGAFTDLLVTLAYAFQYASNWAAYFAGQVNYALTASARWVGYQGEFLKIKALETAGYLTAEEAQERQEIALASYKLHQKVLEDDRPKPPGDFGTMVARVTAAAATIGATGLLLASIPVTGGASLALAAAVGGAGTIMSTSILAQGLVDASATGQADREAYKAKMFDSLMRTYIDKIGRVGATTLFGKVGENYVASLPPQEPSSQFMKTVDEIMKLGAITESLSTQQSGGTQKQYNPRTGMVEDVPVSGNPAYSQAEAARRQSDAQKKYDEAIVGKTPVEVARLTADLEAYKKREAELARSHGAGAPTTTPRAAPAPADTFPGQNVGGIMGTQPVLVAPAGNRPGGGTQNYSGGNTTSHVVYNQTIYTSSPTVIDSRTAAMGAGNR